VARDGKVREASVIGSRDPLDPSRSVAMKAFPLPGRCVGIALEDVTAPMRTRRLQAAEQRVLEMIAEGAPLASVLTSLVLAVEEHSPPTIGVIHLGVDVAPGSPARVAPTLGGDDSALLRVYAAAPILARDERDLGDFVLYVREARRQSEEDRQVLERAANLARIAIERRQLEDQLRELSAHVESVREDERTGIAREIHDELGQALTALKMDIAWIVRRSTSESMHLTRDGLLEKLGAMSKMTDEIIQQVRRISAELRPGVLDDLGLVAAIEWQSQEFENRTGTVCVVDADPMERPLDRHASTAVFRIFQEALTNVTRHAEAKHVDVRLECRAEALSLTVKDDGKGITAEAARSPRSLGLLGVRARARRLGGSVEITGAPGSGTTVSLCVPWGPKGAAT
jgi:signal transduction histidine kinase